MVKAIDEGLRAPPPMTCLQWVNTNGYVSVGASPGPYDINRLPYAREVFEAVDDPTVRRMTIMKGTQVGATETYIQILGYFIDRNPRLTMLVFPTATTVQQMNKLRIGPALRGMPAIANIEMTEEREPYQRKGGSALVTKIGAMTILWRGAGSDSQTDSWPAGLVIIDELDRCKAGTAYKALERNKTYVDGLGITLGNPGFAGEGIDAEYALSDQRKYHLPCPACGVFHVRTFSRVRWRGVQRDGTVGPDSRDINVDPEQAAATAVYKCAACHALIPPSENMAQLRRGVWVPKSWELVVNADGSAYAERPPDVAPKSHRGWHWPELISPLIPSPYAPAAKDFVALKGIITPEFASHKEGRAWRAKATGKVNLEPLLSRVAPGHRLGFVPGEAVALVAGIDRQDRSLYAHVTAIGAKMRRVWTVWYESLEAPLGHGLNVLDGLLSRVWQRTDGRLMRISQAVIDSGDGDHQREVYEYAGSRPSVWALKAFGKDRSSKYMKTAHELVTLDPRSLGFAAASGEAAQNQLARLEDVDPPRDRARAPARWVRCHCRRRRRGCEGGHGAGRVRGDGVGVPCGRGRELPAPHRVRGVCSDREPQARGPHLIRVAGAVVRVETARRVPREPLLRRRGLLDRHRARLRRRSPRIVDRRGGEARNSVT